MISMSVAIGHERQIGLCGGLPWSIPSEQRHFHTLIGGAPALLGRKNFEASEKFVQQRPLFILSHSLDKKSFPQSEFPRFICRSMKDFQDQWEAYKVRNGCDLLFVLGGEDIYRQSSSLWNEVHLSEVDYHGEGDRFFPEIDWSKQWREIKRVRHPVSNETPIAWTYRFLKRE